MVFLWALAAERSVPARRPRSHLPGSPALATEPRHALASPKNPSEPAGAGGSAPKNTGSRFSPGTGQKHPSGDEFRSPHTLQMGTVPTRRLSCQNPSTVLPGRTLPVSPHAAGGQPACSCLSRGREMGPKGFGCGADVPGCRRARTCRRIPPARCSPARAAHGPGTMRGVTPHRPVTPAVTRNGAREGAKGTHPAGI